MSEQIKIVALDDSTDMRGFSFSVLDPIFAQIGAVRDMHVAEILPGSVRGNHYHAYKGEVIVVVHHDDWTLHWDRGPGTLVETRLFVGHGAVAVTPPRNWAHAVQNTGYSSMTIIAVSDAPYDPQATSEVDRDAIHRVVVIP